MATIEIKHQMHSKIWPKLCYHYIGGKEEGKKMAQNVSHDNDIYIKHAKPLNQTTIIPVRLSEVQSQK